MAEQEKSPSISETVLDGMYKGAEREIGVRLSMRKTVTPAGPANSQAGLQAVRVGRSMSNPMPVAPRARAIDAPAAAEPVPGLIDQVPERLKARPPKANVKLAELIDKVPSREELAAKASPAKAKAAEYASQIPSQTPQADGIPPRSQEADDGLSM